MNDKVNVRMCHGCREYLPKEKLLRFCCKDGEIVLDKSKKGGGRGAYLCSYECFLKAFKARRLQSALKCNLKEEKVKDFEREFENA